MKALLRKFNTLTGWRPGKIWMCGDLLIEMAAEIQMTVPHPSPACHEIESGDDGVHFRLNAAGKEAVRRRLTTGSGAGVIPAPIGMMDAYEPELMAMEDGTPLSYQPSWAGDPSDYDSYDPVSISFSSNFSSGSPSSPSESDSPSSDDSSSEQSSSASSSSAESSSSASESESPSSPSSPSDSSSSDSSSSSSSSSSSDSSSSSSSKSAITPFKDQFLKWHCVESPDIAFRDRVPVRRMKLSLLGKVSYFARVPMLFRESVHEESVRVEEIEWENGSTIPMEYGVSENIQVDVLGHRLVFLKIECAGSAKPKSVLLRGSRKDVSDPGKYAAATESEYLSNRQFWNSPQQDR